MTSSRAPRCPRQAAGAFTLIELLVVIAIIAILAAMLLPALQNAKDTAQEVVCQNNQRSYATSMHVYAADAQEFPTVLNWDDPLDAQGKPLNYNQAITLAGVSRTRGDDGVAYGGNTFGLVKELGYFSVTSAAQCPKRPSGPNWNAAGWYGTNNLYYFAGPGMRGQPFITYGHGSRLTAYIPGLGLPNWWATSGSGFRLKGESRSPSAVAQMTCRGWFMGNGWPGLCYEPHGRLPMLSGTVQYDTSWPCCGRFYMYADVHIQRVRIAP